MPFLPLLGADVGAVAAALMLFLLMVAVVYMLKSIAQAIGTWHVGPISIPIGHWFSVIVQPVVNLLTSIGVALIRPVEGWLNAAAYTVTGILGDSLSAINTALDRVDHLYTTVIPQEIARAVGTARGLVDSGVGALEREIAAARTAVGTTIPREIAHEWVKAERLVKGAKNAILAAVGTAVITAETYADQVGAKVWRDTKGLVDALPRIPRELVSGVDYATPAAVAAVGAAVAAITAEFESCAVTTCAGRNNLSSLLNGLLGLSSLAVFGEFLNEVIRDPAAAEAKYAGMFAGLVGTGQSVLDELLSL